MIITHVNLVLGKINGHSKMCSFVTQHNATDVSSFERVCNWHANCRNVHQSSCQIIECIFLYHKPPPTSFKKMRLYVQPVSQPQTMYMALCEWAVCCQSCEQSAQWWRWGWAGISYGQQTQLHRYCDEILKLIVMPFIRRHHLMFQNNNARPHVARIWTQFLEAKNVPVLPWPAYSPDMSPIEHVWDALDQCVLQHVPVQANIQQLHTTTEEEWDNVPQVTINSLINSIWRKCVVLHDANCGHARYWLVFWSTPLLFLKVSLTNRCISLSPVIWNP